MPPPPTAKLILVGFVLAICPQPGPAQGPAQQVNESHRLREQRLDQIMKAQGYPHRPGDPPLSIEVARGFLNSDCDPFGEGPALLRRMGDKIFPAFEAILSDPKSKPLHVRRAFGVLCGMQGNRDRFRELAVRRLSDADAWVRGSAAGLLGEIGGEWDTQPVLVLLSDQDNPVVYKAAEALARMGGRRTLAAMDVWLQTGNHRDDRDLRVHVQKCRDGLQKRLDKAARDIGDRR